MEGDLRVILVLASVKIQHKCDVLRRIQVIKNSEIAEFDILGVGQLVTNV